MNKVVREHYPVANLPEDLQREFEGAKTVRIVAEEAEGTEVAGDFWSLPLDQIKPRSPEQFKLDLRRIRNSGLPSVSPEEAVKRIRELRDEWDDE
ncbi:MAG: hypothetical protein JWM58_361 [Rhizobium sp.]|nr:hypothetical protein [Rhizobium sp.]